MSTAVNDIDVDARRHKVKVVFILMAVFALLGMDAATISIAKDCGYDSSLGRYLMLGDYHIYGFWNYWLWSYSRIGSLIPDIILRGDRWFYGFLLAGGLMSCVYIKNARRLITHGSAQWASAKDIEKADLTGNTGVILGINPYTHKLMRDDSSAHILLLAPTRSGKGVCVIIPTCLTWTHSIFVTDVKGENWIKSAGYRKKYMGQKCIKFEPLNNDGSSARWNPLSEIRMETPYEGSDVDTISGILVNPKGENKDGDYWPQAGKALLKAAIIHHLYWFKREKRPLPNLTNILSSVSNLTELLASMGSYAHITVEEFFRSPNVFQICYGENYITDFSSYNTALSELAGREIRLTSVDELKSELKKYPFKGAREERLEKKITQLEDSLSQLEAEEENISAQQEEADMAYEEADLKADEGKARALDLQEKLARGEIAEADSIAADNKAGELIKEAMHCKAMADKAERMMKQLALRKADLMEQIDVLRQKLAGEETSDSVDGTEENHNSTGGEKIDFKDGGKPWYKLLVHPKVLECAQSLLPKVKSAGGEISGIQSTAATCLNLYQDPIVQENTSTSDFLVEDLLNPAQAVSFFLVIPPNDLERLTPLVRLLINMMLNRLIRDMKDEHIAGVKRQRLLMMLDEFAQFGRFETIETAMAVCASYGIKMCIVTQTITQLYKSYTKDQAIMGNCHTQVIFTPNQDGGVTAKNISEALGNETIISENKNDGGGGLFKGSTSKSGIGRRLKMPEEIARIPFEREIVMCARHNPIYGEKLLYYKDHRFKERAAIPPPVYSDTVRKVATFRDIEAMARPIIQEMRLAQEKVRLAKEKAE